jgi:hypothetical protein
MLAHRVVLVPTTCTMRRERHAPNTVKR